MKPSIRLGDYVRNPTEEALAHTPYGHLEDFELTDFLAEWDLIHREALARLPHRIHPTAYIHPQAIIGDDVIIGPYARVHEFSTVRKGAVLCAGVSVGFNCEVTKAFVGEGTILGHRIGLGTSIVGADAHLSANVTVAGISMWSEHMRKPGKEIFLRAPEGGLYRCGTPTFGAIIGDRTQTGNNISLGPGVAIGRDCRITAGVIMAGRAIPAHHVISTPDAVMHIHPRRAR